MKMIVLLHPQLSQRQRRKNSTTSTSNSDFFQIVSYLLKETDLHYLRKSSDGFNFGQKKCPKIKPSEIFKRPKILRYSKTTLVSLNKPDMTRKDLEMTGKAKAVTKMLEPEDPFKILVVDY